MILIFLFFIWKAIAFYMSQRWLLLELFVTQNIKKKFFVFESKKILFQFAAWYA